MIEGSASSYINFNTIYASNQGPTDFKAATLSPGTYAGSKLQWV